jgi:hypothetical protein
VTADNIKVGSFSVHVVNMNILAGMMHNGAGLLYVSERGGNVCIVNFYVSSINETVEGVGTSWKVSLYPTRDSESQVLSA